MAPGLGTDHHRSCRLSGRSRVLRLARVAEFAHHGEDTFGTERMMQRKRAIAIAAQRQAEMNRLILLASLLLLPAALLLLLISP
jgi:hypothetical protein